MMRKQGFHFHKEAVLLEHNINQLAVWMNQRKNSGIADITTVYEQPVKLVREVLKLMQERIKLKEKDDKMIQTIDARYAPYEECVLSQLDQETAVSLCDDLISLNDALRM